MMARIRNPLIGMRVWKTVADATEAKKLRRIATYLGMEDVKVGERDGQTVVSFTIPPPESEKPS